MVRQRRSQIEVATFRTDGKYLDGRRPEGVTFTTAEEDAKRRDFTINGMFFDPVEDRVIDYVGGQEDLRNEVLRAIGNPDERFEEDHLRLLRAVRFAARFGLEIESETQKAIWSHAPQLARITPERVGEEVRAILTPVTRVAAWELLWESGLGDVIFRFVEPRPETDGGIPLDRFGEIFNQVAPGRAIPVSLALAAATLDRAWPLWPPGSADFRMLLSRPTVSQTVHALRRSLKLSNEESEQLHEILTGLDPLLRDERPSVAVLKRFLARPTAPLSRELLAALPEMVGAERVKWVQEQLSQLQGTEYAPAPLVTGDDLTAAGLTPGPVFKRVLEAVYDAQLEDRVRTKEEAMSLALRLAEEKR
jgi:poly(A) polymerase